MATHCLLNTNGKPCCLNIDVLNLRVCVCTIIMKIWLKLSEGKVSLGRGAWGKGVSGASFDKCTFEFILSESTLPPYIKLKLWEAVFGVTKVNQYLPGCSTPSTNRFTWACSHLQGRWSREDTSVANPKPRGSLRLIDNTVGFHLISPHCATFSPFPLCSRS